MTDEAGNQQSLPFATAGQDTDAPPPSDEVGIGAAKARRRKTLPYCDLDPSRWRDYPDIELGSLWLFGSREKGNGHSLDYHGSFIPQIAAQLLTRYTKAGDIVLDLFLGSGTTAIEAANTRRRCIGVEIQPDLVRQVRSKIGEPRIDRDIFILQGDSTSSRTARAVRRVLARLGEAHAHLLILHPPYWDIIRFSPDPLDMSNSRSLDEFLTSFRRAAKIGYELLEPGRFAGLVIGDKYTAGELVPLGSLTMQVMTDIGFRLKSIVVKNIEGNEIGKGKANNLWRYRALAGGFYIFKHEYVIIAQKPG